MTSRRNFLHGTAASALAVSRFTGLPLRGDRDPGFIDVSRPPDTITARTPAGDQSLRPDGHGRWTGTSVVVTTLDVPGAVRITLLAGTTPVSHLGLRWNGPLGRVRLLLGDAWERGYGDLEWRGFVPDRVLPWYLLTWDGARTHGYGVRTGANAFCYWQADPDGVTLWADVRSGAAPLQLSGRDLLVCDVVSRPGSGHETAFAAQHAFCRQMCAQSRTPATPVYGSNDWYYAYGNNSSATVLADAQHIVDLSPTGANRPFVVIDDGWQPGRGADKSGAGNWDRGNEKFPDLPGLVDQVRRIGAHTGIWMRPLEAPNDAPDAWRLPRSRGTLDPTVPEVRARISADIARLRSWGLGLLKHDYSTFDLLGRWGNQMGATLTRGDWTFREGPVRTTAEVINDLYSTIRIAAGDMLIIGCNTVSHLSAGPFDICRIGDDTSGTDWDRTRRMGVNTLAFRAAQHGAFYAADADCVGVTSAIPWALNRQWLDLLSRSGTTLFVSLAPDALGAAQQHDLRAALALAAVPQPLGEPLDWQRTTWPADWRLMRANRHYDWGHADGGATE